MKEPYVEEVANHNDLESCVGGREDAGEALTEAHAGRAIEPRKAKYQSADALTLGGRQHVDGALSQVPSRLCAVEEPVHAWNLPVGNWEISRSPSGAMVPEGRGWNHVEAISR
jgi:hypothetical protein